MTSKFSEVMMGKIEEGFNSLEKENQELRDLVFSLHARIRVLSGVSSMPYPKELLDKVQSVLHGKRNLEHEWKSGEAAYVLGRAIVIESIDYEQNKARVFKIDNPTSRFNVPISSLHLTRDRHENF